MNLLIPGRHHLLTNFQRDYITSATSRDLQDLKDVNGQPLVLEESIDNLIWAVTSADHSSTRRNPLPSHRREAAIERFSEEFDVPSFVYMIDDLGISPEFANYILKKITVDSDGKFSLTPENTVVGTSTPELIELFEQAGFKALPFEMTGRYPEEYSAPRPWDLVNHIAELGNQGMNWRQDPIYQDEVSRASIDLLERYDLDRLIVNLHSDPLLGDDGDLTETRNYNIYVRALDEGAERKYELVKDFIKPGKIVDIGSGAGSILGEMTLDDRLWESDFYGLEVAHELLRRSRHRKEEGFFNNDNVFFYHRNATTEAVFPDDFVDVFTTFALTHEIESYQGREMLERFMQLLYQQTALNGRWINYDVVGPDNKDETVYMSLNTEDGRNDDWDREFGDREQLRDYLAGLSTYTRFLRFARDFRREEGYQVEFEREEIDGQAFAVLRMEDALEFRTKKDYVDNWQSEMHERFCFWSFDEWKDAVREAGFEVHPHSYAFTNDWIVENQYKGKADLFRKDRTGLSPIDEPDTHMVLVAEKTI